MDLATVLSVVQTILTAIQTLDQLKTTFSSLYQYKDELERLQKTVGFVQSVLEDADAKQGALSSQQRIYIEELKDAIYDANDVLDEFVTLVKQRKAAVLQTHRRHKLLSNKVRSFLSCFSLSIHNLSRKLKDVNKKLNDIASISTKFLFKVEKNPIIMSRKREVAGSFFGENDDGIIGRGDDLDKVVRMLLNQLDSDDDDDDDDDDDVSSLAIVGMGGLGKTRFAQFVFNDSRVRNAFQVRCWISVADYPDQWTLTDVLSKMVIGLTGTNSNMDGLTSARQMSLQIREQLAGKKYLLVLDDVWTESYDKWRAIQNILRVGACGSRIVVTTRSKETARIIAGVRVYELQGLLEEESWRLFERTAFQSNQLENSDDDDFVNLCKEIVKGCMNVPLVIRVVASLLHGQSKDRWVLFRDRKLANIGVHETINNILAPSYYQLDSPLKSCFSYLAIFPKDFVIDKDMLISLWMAQGYVNSEYLGEEYFLTFLHRGFLKDIEDEWGEIRRFKIHGLFHDIAEQQAGKDICRLTSNSLIVDVKVRHLLLVDGFCSQGTIDKTRVTRIRTCLQVCSSSDLLLAGISLANWTCLRSLDLRRLGIETLPESIGKLFHLRWLNLSWCERLNKLCDSITRLVNLQTLDLSNCFSLRELPKDVSKLLDLSTLNITNCKKLSRMPSGMGSLTHLHTLGLFVVGQKSLERKQYCFEELEVLRSMSNLKGFLEVRIGVRDIANYVKEDHGGGYLINKKRLKVIHFTFTGRDRQNFHQKQDVAYKNIACEQSLLEDTLQPHHDLKGLLLEGYNGEILPKWLRKEDNPVLFHLRNLVSLHISDCVMLQCLTKLEELPHLKVLKLKNLPSVEYVLDVKPETLDLEEGLSLFPCLEELDIRDLPKLKGWWPRSGSMVQNKHLLISVPVACFAQLKTLLIADCPILQCFPMCSSLERVSVESHPNPSMVLDSKDEFHRFIKTFTSSDSKSRIVSLVGFESETESSSIDTELTTVIHSWMSRHGYTFSAT